MRHLKAGIAAVSFAFLLGSITATASDAAGPGITGLYRANGVAADLAYATVLEDEPWEKEDAFLLLLTEKDPAGQEDLEVLAGFGELGSALIVGITRSGKVIRCEVAHTALQRMGASTIGILQAEDVQFGDGIMRARLTTNGPVKLLDETWEADLAVEAALPEAE